MGDPIPQRGKVVAYTQTSRPRTQASTRTHIKIMQMKKAEKSHQHTAVITKISTCFGDQPVFIIIFVITCTAEGQLEHNTCR